MVAILVLLAAVVIDAAPGSAAARSAAPSNAARAARSWYQQVVAVLTPLQATLVESLTAASAWQSGHESAAKARQEFGRDIPSVSGARAHLAHLVPLKGHLAVRDDYVAAIGLYLEAIRVELAATELPSGALSGQLQLGFERVRELGDLTFDQGTAQLVALLGPSLAGADAAAATHLPDWSSLGLAPTEPLASSWHSSSDLPSGSQSEAGWASAVRRDGAPSQSRVSAALAGRVSPANLRRMVTFLSSAEALLCSVSPPASHPQASQYVRLGLLVDAEALLAAEAGRLSRGAPAHTLAGAATELGTIGQTVRGQA